MKIWEEWKRRYEAEARAHTCTSKQLTEKASALQQRVEQLEAELIAARADAERWKALSALEQAQVENRQALLESHRGFLRDLRSQIDSVLD